ncbi:MAG: hypothetical protein ACF8LL_08460 [Phycisphaerales bacterium]
MFRRSMIGATVCALTLALGAYAMSGGNPNPGINPPHSHAHGKTYGEWASSWWQWALGIPADRSPLLDDSGQFCGEGQDGPVWFLPTNFGWDAEKYATVPEGKAIFMPIFQVVFGEAVYDCGASNPSVPCDVPTLRDTAAANIMPAEVLLVTIDGVVVEEPFAYRAFSPEPFSIYLPEGNVVGLPEGDYSPNVADGFWLMLAPLAPGEHEISTYVYAPDTPYFGTIEYTVITHLTVE